MGRIVVGVDGSEHSIEALRFALAESRARQGTVEAIITWSYPATADAYGGVGFGGLDPQMFVDSARQTLERAIEDATADPDERAAVVRTISEGGAGHVLVEASRGAELLVVGSRGHGGFAGLLLGSVSNQCVHHAHCPVTVIRAESH
ncbi:MAG: universal stress protein [Acidimicrobiales bacterium]|nr:universal stress protein [Acidimicrobiales bacterium]